MQGTWADGIVIQAVADNLNLKIHITLALTLQSLLLWKQLLLNLYIYVGHLDEFHYVLTKHLVPHICPLKCGTLEIPADAPKTAKQKFTFDLSLHDNSGCDYANYK